MDEDGILRSIVAFVVETFMYMRKNKELHPDDSLLRTGVITSLGVVELVDWVETTFGIHVEPAEITEQNFDTASRIAQFVRSKSVAPVSI